MFDGILVQVLSIGSLALLFGGLLGFSAKKFAVRLDPRVEKITGVLPSVNCGGCGFAGCAQFADAVVKGDATYKGCPVGGASVAGQIAEIMGVDPVAADKKVAFVKCNGIDANVKFNYSYDGPRSCIAASQLATGGNKSCTYGCLGLSSCKNICPFDAIKMVDGIAVVDSKKCTACGKCVGVCPRSLIEIVSEKDTVRVACSSRDSGKTVRENCRSGCIGCSLCQKVCESEAIKVENNIAKVNYEKCTHCLVCVGKCPVKAIKTTELRA